MILSVDRRCIYSYVSVKEDAIILNAVGEAGGPVPANENGIEQWG